MKKNYIQSEVSVARLAMTSFLCASPAAPADPDSFTIGGGMDPGDAL